MFRKFAAVLGILTILAATGCEEPMLKEQIALLLGVQPVEFTPAAGIYSTDQSISLGSSTAGATILYTLDGSEPDADGPGGATQLYTGSIPLAGHGSSILITAIAVKEDMTDSPIENGQFFIYYEKPDPPLIDLASGDYSSHQTFTVSHNTANDAGTRPWNIPSQTNATIYYTTDGTIPKTPNEGGGSPGFGEGGSFNENTSNLSKDVYVNARTYIPGYPTSDTISRHYTVTFAESTATPTFTPTTQINYSPIDIDISCTTPSATIRYTTDGNEPDESSPVFSEGDLDDQWLADDTLTVTAKAWSAGREPSDSASFSYNFSSGTISTPSVTPASGDYAGDVAVTFSSPTYGATIYYTTDGYAPTTASSSAANGSTVTISAGGDYILNAIAHMSGKSSSAVWRHYRVDSSAPFLATTIPSTTMSSAIIVQAAGLSAYGNDVFRYRYNNGSGFGAYANSSDGEIAIGPLPTTGSLTLEVQEGGDGNSWTNSAVRSFTIDRRAPSLADLSAEKPGRRPLISWSPVSSAAVDHYLVRVVGQTDVTSVTGTSWMPPTLLRGDHTVEIKAAETPAAGWSDPQTSLIDTATLQVRDVRIVFVYLSCVTAADGGGGNGEYYGAVSAAMDNADGTSAGVGTLWNVAEADAISLGTGDGSENQSGRAADFTLSDVDPLSNVNLRLLTSIYESDGTSGDDAVAIGTVTLSFSDLWSTAVAAGNKTASFDVLLDNGPDDSQLRYYFRLEIVK